PDAPGALLPLLRLADGALATSADYGRPEQSRRATAFLDPRGTRPCGHGRSATVVAADCMTADALTKVVLASGDPCHPALAVLGAEACLLAAPAGRVAA
ncbi:MAG: FAD:protein FMN transferase, partial [Proteobacteria bacterium]|nr:FAD:protein FMN transferase [Pseudomonadota bacterium]